MPEGGILRPTGAQPDEVLTQHHQLFSLPNGWTTLRRYLERNGPEITGEQRVDLIHTLASLVAELHSQGVTHRDLGSDCVWLGAPTNMSLTGFACAQLPDEQSVSDWLDVLGTYAQPDRPTDPIPTACERDVRSLGLMIKEIAQAKCDVAALPEGWQEVADRATAPVGQRFATAVELADALGELRDPSGPAVDQSRLDSFQTTSIPYVGWPVAGRPQRPSRVMAAQRGTNLLAQTGRGALSKFGTAFSAGMRSVTTRCSRCWRQLPASLQSQSKASLR